MSGNINHMQEVPNRSNFPPNVQAATSHVGSERNLMRE
jgi:hypothetical protein